MRNKEDIAYQKCINPRCGKEYGAREILSRCKECGELLDVCYRWEKIKLPSKLKDFQKRWGNRNNPLDFSGVWRFREFLSFVRDKDIITIGEGQTLLRNAPHTAKYVNISEKHLFLQYEGLNPTGSFKDNGMTAAFSHANMVGAKIAACASTGNTSSSMAAYAAASGILKSIIFVGSGKIALGKLSQGLDYGAKTFQIIGDFDDAMNIVQRISSELNVYLMNSLNPFRLEGQKTIMYRVIEALGWDIPDWIIVPGGNLGNSSSFGKAFSELYSLGLIKKIPRVAIINSKGANTLSTLVNHKGLKWNNGYVDDKIIASYYSYLDTYNIKAKTIASAIEINRPVNLKKALRTLEITNGVVREVSDEEIMDAKAIVATDGIGCEPASASTVAGLKRLREEGLISYDERVVCILTGHQLKDPNATVWYHSFKQDGKNYLKKYNINAVKYDNSPTVIENDIECIKRAINEIIKRG